MQIEVGKFYRTRDGRKAGPVVARNQVNYDGPFLIDGLWNYDDDGKVSSLPEHRDDLVAEWTEATPAERAPEEITWGEWENGTRPHYDYGKKDYQKQRVNGVLQFRYPVRKQPVVETVTLSGGYFGAYGWRFENGISGWNVTYCITFETKDGEPDWSTLRGEDLS